VTESAARSRLIQRECITLPDSIRQAVALAYRATALAQMYKPHEPGPDHAPGPDGFDIRNFECEKVRSRRQGDGGNRPDEVE
jgi:hypothetical protein